MNTYCVLRPLHTLDIKEKDPLKNGGRELGLPPGEARWWKQRVEVTLGVVNWAGKGCGEQSHLRWYDGKKWNRAGEVAKERTESQEEGMKMVGSPAWRWGRMTTSEAEGGWFPLLHTLLNHEELVMVEGGDIYGGQAESHLSGGSKVWKAQGLKGQLLWFLLALGLSALNSNGYYNPGFCRICKSGLAYYLSISNCIDRRGILRSLWPDIFIVMVFF